MKKIFSVILAASSLAVVAQPKKAPQMSPVLAEGYYVNKQKGDTVKGEVMTNPADITDFHKNFSFKPAKGGKVAPVDFKKAKAYGFDGKAFVLYEGGGEPLYLERLVTGRLNFFELKYHGKNPQTGNQDILSYYYIQDNMGEGEFAKLKEIKKVGKTRGTAYVYKDDLKDYMRDQPMIWSDLDKFNFDKQKVMQALNEFNRFYEIKNN
ncbi:MAG: hypothetical protein KF900_12835 [Bacteroidetes bacterium]|nr:hypothetical protein [Bacteroidota bacterium]